MKTVTRAITVILVAIAVGIGWQRVGTTRWAAHLDVASAGEQFTMWLEPVAMLTGWLLIAIPAVMLIRSAWSWFEVRILGHAPRSKARRSGKSHGSAVAHVAKTTP